MLPELVDLLGASFSASEHVEAAHALSSLACGNADVAASIVHLGAIPHLAALLACSELPGKTAAALCLAELMEQADLRVGSVLLTDSSAAHIRTP